MNGIRNNILSVLTFFVICFSRFVFAVEDNPSFKICDITAKIMVKCMIEPDCNYAVSKLDASLRRADIPKRDKELLVKFCSIECEKGKLFRTKQELEAAINGEYKAILNKCLNSKMINGRN